MASERKRSRFRIWIVGGITVSRLLAYTSRNGTKFKVILILVILCMVHSSAALGSSVLEHLLVEMLASLKNLDFISDPEYALLEERDRL